MAERAEGGLRTSHRAALEHQEDLPPERPDERGRAKPASKAERMDAERDIERREGLSPERRGSPAAPSDKAEGDPPHPQDVNEIGEPR